MSPRRRRSGGDTIIIAGERFRLSNAPAPIITFEDNPKYDFKKRVLELLDRDTTMLRNWAWRWDKAEGKRMTSLEQLRQAVRMIIMHADQVASADLCFLTLLHRKPNPLSIHFIINWDGTIIQGLDVMHASFHAADYNMQSVGVELNNELPNLLDSEEAARHAGYARAHAAKGDSFLRHRSRVMRINGFPFQSYGYTDAQYQALIELLKVLTQELQIPAAIPVDEAGEVISRTLEDPNFEGILAHWHLSATKWDPGPGFDWERMLYGVSGEYNSFPVVLEGGRNVAELVTPGRVREEAERLYRNTEEARLGGTYPVGRHRNWHGGVHLHVPEGTPVRALFDGTVVAAHNDQSPTLLGSNNFVLLRHDVSFPAPEDKDPPVLKLYSLYMHLQPFDIDSEGAPDWVRRALGEGDSEAAPRREEAEEEKGFRYTPEDADHTHVARSFLRLGFGMEALRRRRVAAFPLDEDKAVRVRSGEPVGLSASYGPEENRRELVHVEVFTDDTWRHVVDMSVHRRYFTVFSEAVERSLIVRSQDVLGMLTQHRGSSARSRLRPGFISPEEVDSFFAGEEGETERWVFRRAITRHVSEWSDQVDWFQALVIDPETGEPPERPDQMAPRLASLFRGRRAAVREGSAFAEVIRSVLPFIWLSGELAEHIGIEQEPWKGVLYHFHPLYFLDWLTFRAGQRGRVICKGVSKAELRRRVGAESERYAAEQGGLSPEERALFAEHATIEPDAFEPADMLTDELDELRRLQVPGAWEEIEEE